MISTRKSTQILFVLSVLFSVIGCQDEVAQRIPATPIAAADIYQKWNDSLAQKLDWPQEIEFSGFADHNIVPSPACLAVAPNGDVFVGVDMIGSLGKKPGQGRIIKLQDTDNDGRADQYSVFAELDNPRGILPMGNDLYVLHTTFSEVTGIATGMALIKLTDTNGDGVADGSPEYLIRNISSKKFIQSRGTDHATNGIQMGIDGWIYIAVGDFGFHGAVDAAGKAMTQLGGGVLRIRPDGSGMEVYTHGLRNIYDVAIDPFMNIYTRGNTNDGGGWNIRFIHHIQSGEYGYPMLFKHFTNEILPALVDVGGGSGTGALFMEDPNWPEKWNKKPLMADWGRSAIYRHEVSPDRASFTQSEKRMMIVPQVTDLDVDASGRMFLAAWDGAGYSGSPDKGYVVRAVPQGWQYTEGPNFEKSSDSELTQLLESESAKIRLYAQQHLVARKADHVMDQVFALAQNSSASMESRVAAVYTYAQLGGASAIPGLTDLTETAELQEFALRALADRREINAHVPAEPFIAALASTDPRVKAAAIVGIGRLENPALAKHLIDTPMPAVRKEMNAPEEGPHATPNSAIILPHLAVRSLVSLNAVDVCLEAIGSKNTDLALWALKYMHSEKGVDGLIAAYKNTSDPVLSQKLLTSLARLYHKEAPYDGSWWWSTRPDTHGPYYKGIPWEGSAAIGRLIKNEWKLAEGTENEAFFEELNERNRMELVATAMADSGASDEIQMDLDKIKNQKGQIGKASIEDVMLALAEIPGNPQKGKQLFTQQGCVVCHSVEKGQTLKGPYMGQIGSIMNREQIAESILKPNASISQGFSSVYLETKDGSGYSGFISEETAKKIVLRTITGQVHTLQVSDIASREELETSMMPSGLANALSYDEFASLVTYLSTLKK
ncbi:DUF7133 domain-containing protein [Sediminicola luteus]|uniref:Heme-binding protein n=1 Tax=Sediminicola luteus TaxID=319238 RepID=A0A2A4GAA8_9FLAO|nr:c-type cytochrome [Sediminicola luteus]PCE65889.1 heme-binding protein [Sediminicola luteus]